MMNEPSTWPEAMPEWCHKASAELQLRLSQMFGWHTAEDVIQEALKELINGECEKLHFAEYAAFRSWVRTRASSRAKDFLKRERRKEPLDEETSGRCPCPSWTTLSREDSKLFSECVDKLDALDREILMLKYVEQCSSREIALTLWPRETKSQNALNVDVTRASRKAINNLRRLLLDAGVEPITGAFDLEIISLELAFASETRRHARN